MDHPFLSEFDSLSVRILSSVSDREQRMGLFRAIGDRVAAAMLAEEEEDDVTQEHIEEEEEDEEEEDEEARHKLIRFPRV
jgi:TATA-binding protein-associated factor Taf7